MMQIKIDQDKCIRCGACVRVCPPDVFDMTEEGPNESRPEVCIKCGHCVAVCPTDALIHEKMPFEDFSLCKDVPFSLEDFTQIAAQRRSIRRFQAKKIEQEKIEALLQSVQCTPTGENAQELQYLIITEQNIIHQIRDAMAKKFKIAKNLANNSLIKIFMKMFMGSNEANKLGISTERMMYRYQNGEDPFLRGTPVLLIIHVKQKTAMAELDAGIAGYHINLACERIGLGSCWIGFHSVLTKYFRSIRKATQIPKGHKVLATLAIGYPSHKYRRVCPKKPLRIKFL